jgi:hypothetical protein
MNAIWPRELSDQGGSSQGLRGVSTPSDLEMKVRSSVVERQILHNHPQATQLTIQLGEDGRLSLTANTHNDTMKLGSLVVAQDETHPPAIVADNAGPQGASSSMQDVACRM